MHGDPAPLDPEFELLASSPRRFSRRVQLVVLAVVLLLAAVAGVRWLTERDHPVRITAYGQPVADPQSVLDTAQHHFTSYAARRHGALGPGAKCWFQRPPGSSDVAGTLLCGPVLFYDDDPTAPYLQFALIAHGTGSPVRLEALATPTAPEPHAASDGTTLVRPGVTAKPAHTAGISAPIPPPAAPDTLTMTDAVHPSELVRAPTSAVIGADLTTLTLDSFGPVEDFGSGTAERSAPDGMQLFAFRIVFTGGENGFARLSNLDLGVSIGTAPPRPLHLPYGGFPDTGLLFVAAVAPTEPLNLVLTEFGITQTMSLRDGTPATGNIQYLQPSHVLNAQPVALLVPAVVTLANQGPRATRLYVSLDSVERHFFMPDSAAHPARRDHVFLFLGIDYRISDMPGIYGFATPDVITLTPRGGRPIQGRVVNGAATPAFDVPVNMTDATITLAGSEPHLGFGLQFSKPVSFRLHLVPTDD